MSFCALLAPRWTWGLASRAQRVPPSAAALDGGLIGGVCWMVEAGSKARGVLWRWRLIVAANGLTLFVERNARQSANGVSHTISGWRSYRPQSHKVLRGARMSWSLSRSSDFQFKIS